MTPTPALVDRLGPAHAGEALTVQYAAYLSEGRRYGTTEIPPLVTGVRSAVNLGLYGRRGYVETGRERDAAGVEVVGMERVAP